MSADSLAGQLRQLADCAEVRGARQEARDWRRLADDLGAGGGTEAVRLSQLAKLDRLADAPAIPVSLHKSLGDLLLNGADGALDHARSALPRFLRRLLESAAIDPAGALWLARQGIVTSADLEFALAEGRLPVNNAIPAARLRAAADMIAAENTRVPLGRALDLLEGIAQMITASSPETLLVTPAGDARRFEPLVDGLVLTIAALDPAGALDAICALSSWQAVLHRTGRRAVVAYQQVEVDLRVAPPDEYGTLLFSATGSLAHVASMRRRRRPTRLCAREEEVYAQAGLAWIPPELRQGTGELEAAAAGQLPRLVERGHIRGDLHMHSTYSDGGDPLSHMVATAAGLGYEYIAITDHSERSAAARTVSPEALLRQADEIARLRERFPDMVILHGIEVDIMPDGHLDFPDAILEGLDLVLASLHDRAGHDGAQLTRRCLGAMAHPLVNVITHPLNQLVGRDTGYDMDFPSIYAAAAATGTALEIDGAPGHLDLDGAHAREAISAGVTVTIDSDCHRARLLDKQMRMGIGTARRGWVEPRHVLNARSVEDVRAFVAAKRTAKL